MNNHNLSLRGRTSCWLVGGLSCLGLLVIMCIAISVFVLPKMGEFTKDIQDSGKEIEAVSKKMKAISSAIDRYKADNKGAYPSTLAQLAPKYIDPNDVKPIETENNKKVTWVYTPPKPSDPDNFVVLTHKPQIEMSIKMFGQETVMKFEYKLQKDGEIVQEQVQTTPTGIQRNRKSLP